MRFCVGLLGPCCPRTPENIDCAVARHGAVTLVPIDARGLAGFLNRADGDRVAVTADGDREAELITFARVGGFQISLLGPSGSGPGKDVSSARAVQGGIHLVAVDSFCAAVLKVLTHNHSIAIIAERDSISEQGFFFGVRCLDIGLLGPRAVPFHVYVDCTGILDLWFSGLISVDSFCPAAFVDRTHGHGIAVTAQRNPFAELRTRGCIRSFHIRD